MTLTPNPPKDWSEPKVGWCNDEKTLERRAKEIGRAKDKEIYKRYSSEVPKCNRQKGVHPKTPNRYLNFSRRSWDSQVGS
jgi:histone RNA hairpin-binding protein